MAFPSLSFPPSTPLFPKAKAVEDYLKSYAHEFDLLQHIVLGITVTSTRWSGQHWKVSLSNGEEHDFDRLVIANGHYRVPYYPPLPGLDKWIAEGRVTHSAWYRSPKPVGDIVLVVGAGPSGADLAEDMKSFCKTLVHAGAAASSSPEDDGNVKKRGHVVSFSDPGTAADHTVFFDDGSSESGIDHVFLATGYLTSFPFFEPLVNALPPPAPPLPAHLHNSGQHVFPLARELFPLQADFPPGAAAFIGLPIKVVPFPVMEAQMRAVVRVFTAPGALDPLRETVALVARYHALREECSGDDRAVAHRWHRFRAHEQFTYRDTLHEFAGFPGPEWRVRDWEVEMYDHKTELRREWRALEAAGEAEDWVRGIGAGADPTQEWVDLMRKLLKRSSTHAVGTVEEPSLADSKL